MFSENDKRVENVCTRVQEEMLVDMNRLAAIDDISLSLWMYRTLREKVYGNIVKLQSRRDNLQSNQ